jgi:hypothetical protein
MATIMTKDSRAPQDDDLAKLQAESDRLKLRKEHALLRSEIAALGLPWWRKASSVTVITALIAAVIPVTAAVQGYYQKQKELALEEAKQSEQMRTGYLDRLKDEKAMVRILRFVAATSPDPVMRSWATEENKRLEEELSRWRGKIDKQVEIAEGLEKTRQDAMAKPPAERPSDAELERLRINIERAKQRLEEIKGNYEGVARPCKCTPGDPLCSCL